MISGQRKSFQAKRKAKRPSVATAGRDSGSRMRKSTPNRVEPSIIAASSSSRGSVRKYWRISSTPKPVQRRGTISAQKVFSQPKRSMIT